VIRAIRFFVGLPLGRSTFFASECILVFNINNMRRRNFLLGLFLLSVATALGWQIGVQMERQRSQMQYSEFVERFALTGSGATYIEDPEKEVDMELLWTVWRLIDRHYVDPDSLQVDKLRFGAVQGLVRGVGDPYSAFMTPKESNDFQEVLRGELEGIGAELTMRDGRIVVVAPLKGSPASAAGLIPQDVITNVDGKDMSGVSLQEAVHLIRGPKGTDVTLTVFRPKISDKLDITITRDEIKVPSVEYEVIETGTGSVGYIEINQFGENTVSEARASAKALADEEIAGVVLDLRFNGGGYLDGAIDIASIFLTDGKIVSVHRRGEEVESHYAFGDPIIPDLPMAILINEGSASASEIVAGSLQDHGRATIIGKKSFGKGTVQEVVDLPEGSSLRVTVAKWHTPSGKDLSEEGVVPDLEVEMEMEEFVEGRDAQKKRAIEYVLDGD